MEPNISSSSLRSHQIHHHPSCDLIDLFSQISPVCFVILMNLIILTCVLWKTRSNADLQRFTRRLQYRYVSLTLDKQDLPGAAATQEAPVLLLQLHLQSEGWKSEFRRRINSSLLSLHVNVQSVEKHRGLVFEVFKTCVCLRVAELEW